MCTKNIKQELLNKKVYLKDFNQLAIKELQIILQHNNYYSGIIDGLLGPKTYKGLAQFKKDRYLEYADRLGFSTLKALELVAPKTKQKFTPERVSIDENIKLNLFAGKKLGNSMRLPDKTLVYANEWIIPGIPFTWGEITKECIRIPESQNIVDNIIHLVKQYSLIRNQLNMPIKITSGYRPSYLKIGAEKSQHKQGLAIDAIPIDKDLNKLWNIILKSNAYGIGDGRKFGFVHSDWRQNKQRVIFNY